MAVEYAISPNPVLSAAISLGIFGRPGASNELDQLYKRVGPEVSQAINDAATPEARRFDLNKSERRAAVRTAIGVVLASYGLNAQGYPLPPGTPPPPRPPPSTPPPTPQPYPPSEPAFGYSPIRADQPLSPVFSLPGAGGVILGVGAGGGFDADNARRDAIVEKIMKAGRGQKTRRPVRRIVLPKTTTEKILIAGGKLLQKVPKWALPNAELVNLARVIGKALKGGKATVIGLAAQVGGEYAIEKVAGILERSQFEKMTKILGPNDAAARAARMIASKGPTTRGRVSGRTNQASQKIEPARPKPPGNTGSPNRHPGPKPKVSAPLKMAPKPVELAQVTAPKARVPFATPRQIATPRTVPVAQRLGNAIQNIAQLAQIRSLVTQQQRGTSARFFANPPGSTAPAQPAPSTSAQLLNPQSSPQTGTSSGCYTVCRKKTTGTKKRRKPRVCVTPAKARAAGIIK
jgi:hypothetical protein